MALTQADIWQAADELDSEGTRPTLAAIRKRLGTGSYTTISAAMTEWKQTQQRATPSQPQEPLPPAIVEAMEIHAATVWQVAQSLADNRLDAERQQLADEKARHKEAMAEVTELADTLSKENDELQKKLVDYDELHRKNDRLTDQLADQKKRTADELLRSSEQVKKHDQDAATARQEARTALEEAATLRGQIEAYKEQIAALSPTKRNK